MNRRAFRDRRWNGTQLCLCRILLDGESPVGEQWSRLACRLCDGPIAIQRHYRNPQDARLDRRLIRNDVCPGRLATVVSRHGSEGS